MFLYIVETIEYTLHILTYVIFRSGVNRLLCFMTVYVIMYVLVLLIVALWFILRDDLFYVLPCVILFLCVFSPFSIAITLLGEERANLSAFCTSVRFVLVWICRYPLPLGVWEGLWL